MIKIIPKIYNNIILSKIEKSYKSDIFLHINEVILSSNIYQKTFLDDQQTMMLLNFENETFLQFGYYRQMVKKE